MSDAVAPTPQLEITASRQFASWLLEHNASLIFTTYQAGKLFLIGAHEDERLSIFERTFDRCMGLYADAQGFYMSTLYQVWRFENSLAPGAQYNGYDRVYVPLLAHTTGDLDIHDIVVESTGRVVFANTLFSCVAALSGRFSFVPVWQPPFISRLAAEDRCHLNGLALREGRARYATAVSRSDVSDGWREHRRDGGIIIDIESNEVIGTELSMPHSPRWYGERLWLLDSGRGFFGYLDPQAQRFEPICFCPGYLRGLAFIGDYALLGLSQARHNKAFTGLALDENLARRNAHARCGLQVVDLRSGDAVHWLRIEGVVEELYDVVLLPGVKRPMALGFKTDEIRRIVSVGPPHSGHEPPQA